jgi:hypothetical protein
MHHSSCIVCRRMFPPNRLPVFVMGCCLGYMRILANHPGGASSSGRAAPVNTNSNTNSNSNMTPPPLPPTATATASLSPEEEERLMAQKPFCVSATSVTSPAAAYGVIVLFGLLMHFSFPSAAMLFRILIEPAVPLLFFDWILTLTRQKEDEEEEEDDDDVLIGEPDSNGSSKLSKVENILQSKFMQFMGRISLSFYACHLLIAGYVGVFLYYCKHGQLSKDEEDGLLVITLIPSWAILIVFPLSILCGWLLTTYFEAPAQKWLLQKLTSPAEGGGGGQSNRAGGGGAYDHLGADTSLPGVMGSQQQQLTSALSSHFETSAPLDSEEVRISVY